jgi:hypothetical protein
VKMDFMDSFCVSTKYLRQRREECKWFLRVLGATSVISAVKFYYAAPELFRFGKISPILRICAPTPFSFSSIFS